PSITSPLPSTLTREPNGITDGSTAMTFLFGFAFKFCPVAVIPVQPVSHFAVYAVACIVLVWPPDLADTFDGDCFVLLSFGFDFVSTETILFLGFFYTSLSTSFLSTSLPFSKTNSYVFSMLIFLIF